MGVNDFENAISIDFVDDTVTILLKWGLDFEDLGVDVAETEFALADSIDEEFVDKWQIEIADEEIDFFLLFGSLIAVEGMTEAFEELAEFFGGVGYE